VAKNASLLLASEPGIQLRDQLLRIPCVGAAVLTIL
jgi:hypothetical protein